jgi:glycosyltransferase involved in cell wall biosynthesis
MKPMNKSPLMISLDHQLLKSTYGNSQQRHVEYAQNFEHLWVIVLTTQKDHQNKSLPLKYQKDKLSVYATNSINRWFYVFDVWRVVHTLKSKYQTDVVVTQDPLITATSGILLKFAYKWPLLMQVHSSFYLTKRHQPKNIFQLFSRLWALTCLSQADTIRVVNNGVYKILRAKYPRKRIKTLSLATDIKFFYKPVSSGSIARFIHVGRLSKEKNQQLLLRAFKLVHQQHPQIKLTIVGEGSEESTLKRLVTDLALDKAVTFTGGQKKAKVKQLLHQHDAFVLTSNYEGLAVALLEAMAAGLPIISTRVGIVGRVIKHKQHLLIVPVGNENKLVKMFGEVISQPKRAQKYAQKAQKDLFTTYNYHQEMSAWIDLIKTT